MESRDIFVSLVPAAFDTRRVTRDETRNQAALQCERDLPLLLEGPRWVAHAI